MIDQSLIPSVQNPLSTARTIFVLLPQNPNLDKLAASLALFLSLKKTGKEVTIACPTEMRVEFSSLVGIDKISNKLTGRNLVISFDYIDDSIDRVSYNIENHNFNIIVQTNAGFPPLSSEKVRYSYSGGEADLIFVIGSQNLESLSHLSKDLANPDKRTIVNVDAGLNNSQFGKINLVDSVASCCCEIVSQLIFKLGLPIDEDISTNLLLGIEKETQKFISPKVSAETFEAAAFCLRSGARRDGRWPQENRKRKKLPPSLTQTVITKREEPSADWYQPKVYSGNTKI